MHNLQLKARELSRKAGFSASKFEAEFDYDCIDALATGAATAKNHGLIYLGGGSYGRAYSMPNGLVLKVSKTADGTCDWIKMCAEACAGRGPVIKGMPVVLYWRKFSDDVWFAVIEKVLVCGGNNSAVVFRKTADSYGYCQYPYVDKMYALGYASDLHHWNWGWAELQKDYVAFDPSSSEGGSDCGTVQYIEPLIDWSNLPTPWWCPNVKNLRQTARI